MALESDEEGYVACQCDSDETSYNVPYKYYYMVHAAVMEDAC